MNNTNKINNTIIIISVQILIMFHRLEMHIERMCWII